MRFVFNFRSQNLMEGSCCECMIRDAHAEGIEHFKSKSIEHWKSVCTQAGYHIPHSVMWFTSLQTIYQYHWQDQDVAKMFACNCTVYMVSMESMTAGSWTVHWLVHWVLKEWLHWCIIDSILLPMVSIPNQYMPMSPNTLITHHIRRNCHADKMKMM